jgi:hypothetical protein
VVGEEPRQRGDLLGERLVDDVHELVDRTAAEPVAADAGELPRGAGVRRLQHVLDRAAHQNLAVERFEASERELLEVLVAPALRELARRVGLPGLAEHADRDHLTVAAVERLVRAEAGSAADLLREAAVDAAHEVVHRPLVQPVAPDACEHSLLPSSRMPEISGSRR